MQQAKPESPLAQAFTSELTKQGSSLKATYLLSKILRHKQPLSLEKVGPLIPFIVRKLCELYYYDEIQNLKKPTSQAKMDDYRRKVDDLLQPVLTKIGSILYGIQTDTSSEKTLRNFLSLVTTLGIDVATYFYDSAPTFMNADFRNNDLFFILIRHSCDLH